MSDLLRENAALLAVVALIGVWFLMRTRATRLGPDASVGGVAGGGRPTVIEFFSNA